MGIGFPDEPLCGVHLPLVEMRTKWSDPETNTGMKTITTYKTVFSIFPDCFSFYTIVAKTGKLSIILPGSFPCFLFTENTARTLFFNG